MFAFGPANNQWSALGRGIGFTFGSGSTDPIDGDSSAVRSLAAGPSGKLYVGGIFNTAGNTTKVSVSNIAQWDASSGLWSSLGTGATNPSGGYLGADVRALGVLSGTLYATGSFERAGGVATRFAAKWDGSAWSALGTGLGGEGKAVTISGGQVYFGGVFATAGPGSAWNVARWDPLGNSWSSLSEGVSVFHPSGASGSARRFPCFYKRGVDGDGPHKHS